MPTLNFTHFSGAVLRHRKYFAVEEGGVLFLTPERGHDASRHDPFQTVDDLLLDVVKAGAEVANFSPFLDYCLVHKILPLRDAEFWLYGDFFTARPLEAQTLTDTLLAFVGRWGLPAWENMVTTTYPARYAQRLMALRQSGEEAPHYLLRYVAIRRACQRSGAVPVCTLALLLLNFYLEWIEGVTDNAFPIRGAEWLMDCGQEKTPRLNARVSDLTTCIHLAYALASAGEGKSLRQCKNCGRFFIARDRRAEYCSPQCRGAYNSKMTRKRVKERERIQVEGKF